LSVQSNPTATHSQHEENANSRTDVAAERVGTTEQHRYSESLSSIKGRETFLGEAPLKRRKKEIHKSGKGICISSREIRIFLPDLCILPREICISLPEIHISSGELESSSRETTKSPVH